jgi:hypothetical protein
MAGKSKHGKHLPRSKRKGKKTFTAPAVLKPAAAEASKPATEAAKAPVMVAQASNVAAELRTIGIVAGILIVILVILALIFA